MIDMTIPAVAMPFDADLCPKIPKTKPVIATGNPQIGKNQAPRLRIPRINDAIENPELVGLDTSIT